MDTQEHIEIKHALSAGHSQTDEGPYYHSAWWESYKGGVKGKLGGGVIGALIGAGVGVAAAGVLTLAGIGLTGAAIVTAGFAAGGMLYSAHEFSKVGRVTGAVAAAHEKSEERMKNFEDGKFAEIKREINELKSLVTGKPLAPESISQPVEVLADYKTTHSDKREGRMQLIFWKIAAIGLTVGLAAGALLAGGGLAGHALEAVGLATDLSQPAIYVASMTTLGLFGASFGVNRDIFRAIFDKTDLLFKGIISNSRERAKSIDSPQPAVKQALSESPITTVVYTDFPQSDTYHRDKVLAQAKQTLLSMDHTKAIPH